MSPHISNFSQKLGATPRKISCVTFPKIPFVPEKKTHCLISTIIERPFVLLFFLCGLLILFSDFGRLLIWNFFLSLHMAFQVKRRGLLAQVTCLLSSSAPLAGRGKGESSRSTGDLGYFQHPPTKQVVCPISFWYVSNEILYLGEKEWGGSGL